MRPERQAVLQIKSFLESESEMDLGELTAVAEQYVRLCEATNARLRRCEQYLRSGMRTEAIHLAEAAPPALEMAAALDFYGVEAWRQFCRQDKRFVVPPAIAAEVVAWLNEAYIQEESVSELLAEYRKLQLVRRGALPEKILLLRRLAKLDKENAPHWRDDLREHEGARLEELGADIRSAVAAEDLQAMEALQAELSNPEWLRKPSERVIKELDANVHRVRVKQAHVTGRQIAQEAWDAYGALDHAGAGDALRQWQLLVQAGYFSPSADLAANMEEVREWFGIEQKKLDDEREFESALAQLTDSLDQGLRRAELERLLFAVLRHNREVPAALRTRADHAIQDARVAEERKKRLVIAAAIILVLLVAMPTFLIARSAVAKRRRTQWGQQIDASCESEDYQTAGKLLAELNERHPRIGAEPAFEERALRIQTGLADHQNRHERFEELLVQLQHIQQAGFLQEEPYLEIEKMAEELARTPEERGDLEDWRIVARRNEAQLQLQRDNQFSVSADKALTEFDALDELDPEEQADEYRASLDRIAGQLEIARAMPDISEQVRMRLPTLELKVGAYRNALREAARTKADRERLLAQIGRGIYDLSDYERALQEFVKEFSHHEKTPDFERILADCVLGKDLERGRDWTVAYDEETAKKLEEFFASPDSERSIWRPSLEWLRDQIATAPNVREVVEGVYRFRENPRFYELRRLLYTDPTAAEPLVYYYVDPPKVLGSASGVKALVRYSIDVFEEGSELVTKELMVPPIPADPMATLAPHCKWYRDLCRAIRRVDPPDCATLLLRSLEELRADPDVDPVVKAIFMLAFLEDMKKLMPSNTERIDELIDRFSLVSTNVSWMSPQPDNATRDARLEIKDILQDMTELSEMAFGTIIMNRIHNTSLSRNPRCIGWMSPAEAEGELRMDVRDSGEAEAWIVTGRADGTPALYIVASRDADGKLAVDPAQQDRLYEGQPLFAPTGGEPTLTILNGIVEDIPSDQRHFMDQVSWPPCWPVNGRDLKLAGRGPIDDQRRLLCALAGAGYGAPRP